MVNWYYVRGPERVGPVNEQVLRDLFNKQELNLESYVWRKGFQNWMRLKDVKELDFSQKSSPKTSEQIKKSVSPEIEFHFDWNNLNPTEELFFLKVGEDREGFSDTKYFGPYSLNELLEAREEKRINNKTLLYAIGLPGWIEAGATPLNPVRFDLDLSHIQKSAPLLFVMNKDQSQVVALINSADPKKCTLLSAGPYSPGEEKLCSLYYGKELIAKNVKINIEEYLAKEQFVKCRFIELDSKAQMAIEKYV